MDTEQTFSVSSPQHTAEMAWIDALVNVETKAAVYLRSCFPHLRPVTGDDDTPNWVCLEFDLLEYGSGRVSLDDGERATLELHVLPLKAWSAVHDAVFVNGAYFNAYDERGDLHNDIRAAAPGVYLGQSEARDAEDSLVISADGTASIEVNRIGMDVAAHALVALAHGIEGTRAAICTRCNVVHWRHQITDPDPCTGFTLACRACREASAEASCASGRGRDCEGPTEKQPAETAQNLDSLAPLLAQVTQAELLAMVKAGVDLYGEYGDAEGVLTADQREALNRTAPLINQLG
ncbi:hypothetical protein [Streptomyces sp. NPDC051572]|uniref:hypothetical protein n=1 Tax=Streptomyces sp. NPDC051572 TaxID=3155802 RepID=UPI00344F7D87